MKVFKFILVVLFVYVLVMVVSYDPRIVLWVLGLVVFVLFCFFLRGFYRFLINKEGQ